jgi:hypothetical protein
MNIGVNSDNDIYFVDGELPLVTGIEELRQLVGQVLRSFLGDWFLDYEIGLPYFQTIFQKATSISDIEGIFLDRISGIPGILDISKFDIEYDPETRLLNIVFTSRTTDGILNFNLLEA